ncbi:hypothetical protein JTB14_036505 [Gonioctena quinquepunctata]|nr:hypothetical protein JTB14_036505 [Gonioctena quinquepunctata]
MTLRRLKGGARSSNARRCGRELYLEMRNVFAFTNVDDENTKGDIAEELAERYEHNSTNANYDESFLTHNVAQESILIVIENNQDPINKSITESEFSEALTSLKNTAPGPDDNTTSF